MLKNSIFSLISIFLFAACGSNHDDGTTNVGGATNVPNSIAPFVAGKTVMNSKLGGTWSSACVSETSDGVVSSHRDQYTFYRDGIALYSTLSKSANCDAPALVAFAFMSSAPTAVGTSGLEFSGTYGVSSLQKFEMVPMTDEITDIFKAGKLCGLDSWETNVSTSVLHTSCASISLVGDDSGHYTSMKISEDGNSLTISDCQTGGACNNAQVLNKNL